MKEKTLLGFVGGVCKEISKNMRDDDAPVATTKDVKDIISEVVTKTFVDSLSAKSADPTTVVNESGRTLLFANGTPVVISAREDGEEGALVTWEGGEILLTVEDSVFGGRHDDDTPTNTSVTMNGGTLKNVIGGGLHKSHTVIAKLVINDGTVTGVQGAGCSSFVTDCKCENATWYTGDPELSPCVTDEVNLTVNGGIVKFLLFGGGEGISYCKKVNLAINGGKMYYVTASGSNGRTEEVNSSITGGSIKVYQGINRGTTGKITSVINGGVIGKAFACGEIPFSGSPEKPNGNDASGVVTISSLTINGGTVEEVSAGGNDYKIIEDGNESVTVVDNRK